MPLVKLDNKEIYYTKKGSGPPVIFLAGTSLGTFTWRKVIECMGDSYMSVAIDVRGSGQSDAPKGPYSVESMANDVVGIIDHIEIEKPVVVGHSMGGFIALELALSKEPAIGGLVLVSTSSVGHPNHLGTSQNAKKALNRISGSIEEIFEEMIEVGVGKKIKKENPASLRDFFSSHLKHPPRGFGFAGQRAAARKFDARPNLREIHCPCLVVHGTEDQVISVENGQKLCSDINGARFVELEGVGHFPQIEAPMDLASIIIGMA